MTPRDSKTRGFTLIELMFSMAISSIILFLAIAVLRTSGDGYERISGNLTGQREGRTLVNQLKSDLSSAIFHRDFTREKSTAAWPADRLGFLCLKASDAQSEAGRIGDLCAVVYYLKDMAIDGRSMRCVMRGFRESAETFKALTEHNVPSLYMERPNIDEPIAFGVVSFEACPKSRDSSGKWMEWDRNTEVGPDAIDLRVVVALRDLAVKLKTSGDWDGSDTAGTMIGPPDDVSRNKNLEVFSTMIRFGSYEGY